MADPVRISRFGFVNSYLVDEDDGLTLIDTMLPGGAKAILARAEQLGKPIARIALTHAHADHIGSLDALAEQLPGVEVLITARDERLLSKDKTLEPGEEIGKLRGGYPGAKTKPTRTIAPGERVGSLEVVASPGHTPGHVSFLDTRDGTLYAGDAYSTLGGTATSAKGKLPIRLSWFAWHRPTALESARALRALDPAVLAPGHGKVIRDPGPEMDAAIARGTKPG
jgi:glyoxylase-like metal-dependent hydrolase (beta-lactamase superfamily II)